jgi:hypothetical protein
MKYIIIGGGPSGLSLAYFLSQNNIKVELLEMDKQLGGSWNSQWIEDKYFSENSPRVLVLNEYLKKFLNDLNLNNKNNLVSVYGNFFSSNIKMLKFILKNFNLKDYFIFINGYFRFYINDDNISLQEWLNSTKLSKNGKNAIKIISILICDRPSKTNASVFFNSLGLSNLKQFKEPNKWHEIIENKIKKNVNFHKKCKVISLIEKNNKITGIEYIKLNTNKKCSMFGDKIVICTQSNGIYNILKNSNKKVQNNWCDFYKIKNWVENTYYSGFGFQLHFDKVVKFQSDWCWSCMGKWTVIILPVSNWLKEYSKDNNVKTVWSCCIVDMDTKSDRINKTANECTKEEIIEECLHQIPRVPKPYHITISLGVKRINDKWISKNTGFTKNIYGSLPFKGKINNLFAIGCFNNQKSIAHFGIAVESSCKYLNKYETKVKDIYKVNKYNNLHILILIILIIYLYYK